MGRGAPKTGRVVTYGPVATLAEFRECVNQYKRERLTVDRFARLACPDEFDAVTFPQKRMAATMPHVWYRGQSRPWPLLPKILRAEYTLESEQRAMHEFLEKASQLDSACSDRATALFIAQHYGLPTRLLDWTDDSEVALYFATEDHDCDNNSPVVWLVNPHALNSVCARCSVLPSENRNDGISYLAERGKDAGRYIVDYEFGKGNIDLAFDAKASALLRPIALETNGVESRMRAQKSRFTVHGSENLSFNEIFSSTVLMTEGILARIEISTSAMRSISEELEREGYCTSRVFPDITGVVQEVKRRYFRSPQYRSSTNESMP